MRRSGGAQRLELVQWLAFPLRPLALPLRPRCLVRPDRLKPDQNRRDVVPGRRVKLNRPDVGCTQPGLVLNDLERAKKNPPKIPR